jgi:D-threo-aldose 1-dehydrogenase
VSQGFASRALRTGLRLSEIGLGGAPLGNLYRSFGDDQAGSTCRAALDAGVTYFDTAPFYGFGLSERRLGDALRGHRHSTVSTKVGRLLKPDPSVVDDSLRQGFASPMPFAAVYDYTYDGILASWEASLQRLGLAMIDVLYVHDIGAHTHGPMSEHFFSQLTAGGGFRALSELRSGGAINAYGLGVNEIEVCRRAMDHTDLDILLLAGRYTLLEQTALDTLLPECQRRHVAVVIGGPYNSGILAAGTGTGSALHYNYGPAPAEVIERVRRLESCCAEFAIPLAAAALQFPLAHPSVVSVIPGLVSAAQIAQTRALYATEIPVEFWSALERQGLLRSDAPCPGVAAA